MKSIRSIEVLKPVLTERFALKVIFDSGEVKKYVLPLSSENKEFCEDEIISFASFDFSNEIWASVEIYTLEDIGVSKEGIGFSNGYFISAEQIYVDSSVYVEPTIAEEIIYEDDTYFIKKLWQTTAPIYKHNGVYKALTAGNAFNSKGISTFFSLDGKRLISLDFDYMSECANGLVCVNIKNYGCKLIDANMNVYPKGDVFYDYVSIEKCYYEPKKYLAAFKKGEWLLVDYEGNETPIIPINPDTEYEEVCVFYDGMAKVSLLKFPFLFTKFAYYTEDRDIAGIWGYINEEGKEIIEPQYIFATDFENGYAIVCKGKWELSKKWSEYNAERCWSDEMLWGLIDKTGKEVIPCQFDDVKLITDNYYKVVPNVYKVHVGGWENGKWGIMNAKGEWLAQPVIEEIGYDYRDGLITFFGDDYDRFDDDSKTGIFDLNAKSILFEPQFLDVNFLENGRIEVEVYDEKIGRKIKKIIDSQGNEVFHSKYDRFSINEKEKYIKVYRKTEDGKGLNGIIDLDGNIIVPCKYEAGGLYGLWEVSMKDKYFVFKENDKVGIMSFSGEVLVPAQYSGINFRNKDFIEVYIGEDNDKKVGLIDKIGKVILEPIYTFIDFEDDNRFICGHRNSLGSTELCEVMEYFIKV